MKIIITENQYRELEEIHLATGELERFPISDSIEMIEEIGFNKFYSFLNDYLKKHLDIDLHKIKNSKLKISKFLDNIKYSRTEKDTDLIDYSESKKLRKLENIKVLSHIIYKFFKQESKTSRNVIKFSEFEDLKFFRFNLTSDIKYWFFTSDEKRFLGVILGNTAQDINKSISEKFGKNAFIVNLSSIMENMKGVGYGKQMYLAILNDCGVILSDSVLYKDSYNIWVHALPKYVSYVGYIKKNNELKDIYDLPNEKIENVYRFFATNDEKIIKKLAK